MWLPCIARGKLAGCGAGTSVVLGSAAARHALKPPWSTLILSLG